MKWTLALSLLVPAFAANAAATQYPVTVDNCGVPLTFNERPSRVVVHDINMAEMAFALGLQEDMVGVTGITGWYKMSPEFKTKLGSIPELAPKYATLENLLVAKPDFFFAGWNYGMKVGGEVTPATLKPYGVNTLILTESCVHTAKEKKPASMELLYGDIQKLGVIFDKQDKANALVTEWKEKMAALPKPEAGAKAPRVFLYDSGEDKPFTSGKYAMLNAMIQEAGGDNIAGDMEFSWARTSWETVAKANPEVIILLDYQSGGGADALRRFLEDHPLMQYTDAVKNASYVKLRYEELTPGPANIEAVEKLAHGFFKN